MERSLLNVGPECGHGCVIGFRATSSNVWPLSISRAPTTPAASPWLTAGKAPVVERATTPSTQTSPLLPALARLRMSHELREPWQRSAPRFIDHGLTRRCGCGSGGPRHYSTGRPSPLGDETHARSVVWHAPPVWRSGQQRPPALPHFICTPCYTLTAAPVSAGARLWVWTTERATQPTEQWSRRCQLARSTIRCCRLYPLRMPSRSCDGVPCYVSRCAMHAVSRVPRPRWPSPKERTTVQR